MNSKKAVVFLSLLVFVGIFRAEAYSDYADYYLSMDCKPTKNFVRITPAETESAPADRSDKECIFSNGRTVKARIGVGPTYPYGEGGADPERWLSIWIDKKKVVSKFTYYTYWSCGRDREKHPECDLYFEVDSQGYKLCRANNEQKFTCEFTPNEKLPKIRDALEYPLPNEKHRPPAKSIATLFAKDKTFCEKFPHLIEPLSAHGDQGWYVVPPDGAELFFDNETSPYEYAGHYEHFSLDINNDGKKETVVALYSRTHYRDGDIFFIFTDSFVPEPVVKELGSTNSEGIYAKAANRIFPHYWPDRSDKWEKLLANENADDGAYQVKNVMAPWRDIEDMPIFTFRYWYLWPFRYNQTTYFLTASREAAKMHWYTVLRPEPDEVRWL